MKRWLFFFCLPFSFCFGFSFTDPYSGLNLDIPDAFSFTEKDQCGDFWWYQFRDELGNKLTIEVEEYEFHKTHYEHFHKALTNGAGEKEEMVLEGFEFKGFKIGDLEIAKCQLRILAIADMYREPLCLCDYLFVKEHYGFTISLMKVEDGSDINGMMQPLLESIHFAD